MVISIKGLTYNEVTDFFESFDAGEGDMDIYINDLGYVDAAAGDYRPFVEIDVNSPSEEDDLIDVAEQLADEEPDAEVEFIG
tara:strand:+ start:132 stop:377 length:246 start_codon:yes stop_codon:yes gene_type:complete